MTAEEFRTRWTGHVPKVQDVTGEYAVLVPLVRQNGVWNLLYEVRAQKLRRQPGEVCFPGGKLEGEESPRECALRETWEELGIPPERVRVLGELDFIAHRANFIMYPILGVVENMSYVECPDCGKQIKVFGESHVDEIAEKYSLPVLAKMPIDPALAKNADEGLIETFSGDYLDNAAQKVAALLK